MKSNQEKLEDLGWLDEDGICQFPEKVVACTLGFESPGLPITFFGKATTDQLQEAIDKGWIKFADGNGDYMSFSEYVAAYPAYPDPVFQLELRGTWPPKAENFHVIGR